MKKILFLFISLLLLTQCDDGDFNEPSFVFENNINYCGDLIIHNIGQDDSEALILDIPITNTDNSFFKTVWEDKEYDLTDKIYYRVFDDVVGSDYFCQQIPPASPNLVNEWIGSGKVIINNTVVEDDQDGIPALEEDLNGDGNLDNDDFDQDGIPNYLDIDDDNDSILTINEIKDDGTFIYSDITNPSTPNHLNTDDDGDGILTINEILDSNGDEIKDYLDGNIAIEQEDSGIVAPNKYNLQYTMSIVIKNLSLVNSSGNAINYTNFEYGVKVGDFTIKEE